MEGPANTLNYMIAGYAVFFVVMLVYLASMVIRWRNLKQDEALLEEMERDTKS